MKITRIAAVMADGGYRIIVLEGRGLGVPPPQLLGERAARPAGCRRATFTTQ
jgi:hypothetical protein